MDIAADTVENEAQIICDLLAVLRDGYPSIYGSLLFDPVTNQTYFKIYNRNSGNLWGGLLSGEDPRYIKLCMTKLKNDEKVQLYLELYNEARKERHLEIIYFRLWNILEIVASSKSFKGQVKRDWDGRSRRDWNGNIITDQAKVKIRYKKELVFELLRVVFNAAQVPKEFFAQGLKQGSIPEMMPIWYQHRNCVVHGGGCFPDDPVFCKNRACKEAHNEIISNKGDRNSFTDDYLRNLRETVKIVINSELN